MSLHLLRRMLFIFVAATFTALCVDSYLSENRRPFFTSVGIIGEYGTQRGRDGEDVQIPRTLPSETDEASDPWNTAQSEAPSSDASASVAESSSPSSASASSQIPSSSASSSVSSSSSAAASSNSGSSSSVPAADTTPPSVPLNLSASTVSQTGVTLVWSASHDSGGAVSYLVYSGSALVAAVSGTSCTVSGLSPGTNYSFCVRAKDQAGNLSAPSALLHVTTSPAPPPPAPSKIVAGYFAGWSAYSGYSPLQVAASKLTHINYAFANIGSDLKIAVGDPGVDIQNFQKLHSLKTSYPHLKTLISVGGWTWSGRFSDVALTDSSRTVFADSVVAFIKQYGFDGVDIDWEYPVGGGLPTNISRPADKQNFTLLMQKLRQKLDAQGAADGRKYLLSFAGGAGSGYAANTELSALKNYVDYAIIMTYDIHGPWDKYADLNAPLYNPAEATPQLKWSADSGVRLWTSKGFPASKLVMGVPFYGYLYKGVSSINNGLYSTYTGSSSISFDSIVSAYLSNPITKRFYHPEGKVPWLISGTSFISYDDEYSMAQKAAYIKTNGLAGAAAWELSQNKNGALLNALWSALK